MLRVTEIIRLNGLIDASWSGDFAMRRGTAIHQATALDDLGDLDESSVDPEVAPYLASWRTWKAQTRIEFEAIELPVEHEAMGYRGTLDRIMLLAGLGRAVVDLKTGQPAAWHSIQLALYAMAWAAQRGAATPRRMAIYLSAEGRAPAIAEYSDRCDFDRAKALVTVAHMKTELGITT